MTSDPSPDELAAAAGRLSDVAQTAPSMRLRMDIRLVLQALVQAPQGGRGNIESVDEIAAIPKEARPAKVSSPLESGAMFVHEDGAQVHLLGYVPGRVWKKLTLGFVKPDGEEIVWEYVADGPPDLLSSPAGSGAQAEHRDVPPPPGDAGGSEAADVIASLREENNATWAFVKEFDASTDYTGEPLAKSVADLLDEWHEELLDLKSRLSVCVEALEPFARNVDAVSLSKALGHITRAHLHLARQALTGSACSEGEENGPSSVETALRPQEPQSSAPSSTGKGEP